MPPRSVCLNVFTTSLGNGLIKREADAVVRDMEEKHSDRVADERRRHDSLQEDSISATAPFATSVASTSFASPASSISTHAVASPAGIGAMPTSNQFFPTAFPTICSTCIRPPPGGHSLLRCSRCKRAYYCSRTCQKQAWKSHKIDCDPLSSPSPSSAIQTPDVSVPGSPAQAADEQNFDLSTSVTRDTSRLCDAIQDSVYNALTAAN